MDERVVFEALLAQLRYPVYRMKLITAHKISDLMSADGSDGYKKQFLKWLSERAYESEVITGLSILGLLDKKNLIDLTLVRSHIKKYSVLSDMLINEIYGEKTLFPIWTKQHSGQVPISYKIPPDFLDKSTQYVAPIFLDDFKRFGENYSNYLVKQWAWEYENIKHLLGDYTTSVDYFLKSIDKSEYINCYHLKLSDAFQSAYLRTLNFAVSQGMSLEFAQYCASNAYTLDFELEKVSQNIKPEVLSKINELDCLESTTLQNLSELAKNLSENLESVMVAGSFPVCRENNFAVDIDINSCLSLDEKGFEKIELFSSREFILEKNCDFHEWVKQKDFFDYIRNPIDDRGIYLAACKILPRRFPRWQFEIICRGLFVPSPLLIGENFRVEYDDQQISYIIDEEIIAYWIFWLDNWRPCHLRQLDSSIGTALFVRRETIEKKLNENGFKIGTVAKLNYLTREEDYGAFEYRNLISKAVYF